LAVALIDRALVTCAYLIRAFPIRTLATVIAALAILAPSSAVSRPHACRRN
jgi:hypothetical protein